MSTFKALKTIKIGERYYYPGDLIDASNDGRDWVAMQKLKLVAGISLPPKTEVVAEETITETPVEVKEKDLTNDDKHDKVVPEIVKAGPRWRKVMLGEEQIGKTVGSDEEAQAIIDEWLEKQTK